MPPMRRPGATGAHTSTHVGRQFPLRVTLDVRRRPTSARRRRRRHRLLVDGRSSPPAPTFNRAIRQHHNNKAWRIVWRWRSWVSCSAWLRLPAGGPGVRPSADRLLDDSSPRPAKRREGRGEGRPGRGARDRPRSRAPSPARANGAFPDAENILTPADRPQEIVLVTNFGLVTSTDGGTTTGCGRRAGRQHARHARARR